MWTSPWDASATSITEAYRQHWQIELFFRWLKQGLRIQTFYGTSANAVRLQLRVSVCAYRAMATPRKKLGISKNLTTLVQVLSLHALSRTPVSELFFDNDTSLLDADIPNQLSFNDLY